MEEEGAAKSTFQKQLRDLQTQMQELQEDLDAEKEARNKAEKLKRDLNEVGLDNRGKNELFSVYVSIGSDSSTIVWCYSEHSCTALNSVYCIGCFRNLRL